MWKDRAAGFPLGSKVCTCIWDELFLSPTVIRPGGICSSMALPIVAAKLVLAAPCNGIFQAIMYSLTPLNFAVIDHKSPCDCAIGPDDASQPLLEFRHRNLLFLSDP
jgi:hypothetical protein